VKIGMIGGGNVAKFLLKSINVDRQLPNCTVESVFLRRPEAAEEWESTYGTRTYHDMDAFLSSGIDLVVEAATVQAVRDYAEKIISRRKDLVIISVGALVDQELYQRLNELCRLLGTRIFPQNINVAIVLSLAGLGCDNTRVRIVADPKATKNTHSIEAVGSFGRMCVRLENDPMPDNPKTSYLAALSVLSTLKKQTERISIG
jgi:predicted dinucleotide-utilizing enzyme